jgi:hypothetical protein
VFAQPYRQKIGVPANDIGFVGDVEVSQPQLGAPGRFSFELGPLLAARRVGARRFPC